jgi:hypothetical protein
MDIKYALAVCFTVLVIVFTGVSLVTTTRPVGDQNQAMMGVVVATSILASIAGWWIGYMLFKGNPQAQLTFLLFFVFVLFASTLTTATASAFQLYGLREGLATKA